MASRALVIGAGTYVAGSGIDSYPTIRASAREYGKVLALDEMWGPDRCRVLDDSEVETVNGVMDALQEAADATSWEDTLLVVYVGHGQVWEGIPGNAGEVHFAVGSSYQEKPWTWLSSWYIYRAMRKASAKLKVLIADCCYSNELGSLGEEMALPGVLAQPPAGTCVFTALDALRNERLASSEGCKSLLTPFSSCTTFSGHLLKVLRQGTKAPHGQLTIGQLYDAVDEGMKRCRHPAPGRRLNGDARDDTPLFTNQMPREKRRPQLRDRTGPPSSRSLDRIERLIEDLLQDRASHLDALLTDAGTVGDVVRRLRTRSDERCQELLRRIDDRAREAFMGTPRLFAQYLKRSRPAGGIE